MAKKKAAARKTAAPPPKGAAADGVKLRRIALAVLLAGLIVRLAIAWQPFGFQIRYGPLVDDAFYSLNLARHLARGDGPTCDGVNFTNGFQPLYVFLMVPVYWVWPDDLIHPVYAAMTMLALAAAGAGWFLFRIARRRWGLGPALFALSGFCFSPYFITHSINGLETSLAALGWMAALDLYLGRIKPGTDRPTDRLMLAAVLAALVFTRVDGGILAAAIALDYLLRPAEGSKLFRDRLIGLAQIAAAAWLLYSPWVVWNVVKFGTPLPSSGNAVRLISQLFGDWELTFKLKPFEPGHPPWLFLLDNFLYIFRVRIYGQLFFPADLVSYFLWKIAPALQLPALNSLPVTIALFGAGLVWARRLERELEVLFIAIALMYFAYGFYIFGHWFYNRYFFPVELCLLLLSAAVFRDIMNRIPKSKAGYFLAGLGAVYGLIFWGSANINFLGNENDKIFNYYTINQSIDQYLKPEAKIGAFQSATIAYFCRHQVVNLDGVVNPGAYQALQDKKMTAYLIENNITYVVDYYWILDRLLFSRLTPEQRKSFTLVSPRDHVIQMYKLIGPGP